MLLKSLVTILAFDLILAIVAIPLILRKVPRNVVYGFRTRATLENDFVWYEANAYFGRGILRSSFASVLLIVFLYFSDFLSPHDYLLASTVVLVAPSMVAVLLTLRYIKKKSRAGKM
jgi:hypothetical protein